MYGVFGGYTRWAVVFLIIFVLFFLFVPAYGYGVPVVGAPGVAVTKYHHHHHTATGHPMMGGYNMMGMPGYSYESPSSPS
jgi:hypothetical protein